MSIIAIFNTNNNTIDRGIFSKKHTQSSVTDFDIKSRRKLKVMKSFVISEGFEGKSFNINNVMILTF